MSRTALFTAVIVSLVWGIGVGSYAIRERDAQAEMMGMFMADRCREQPARSDHGRARCEDAREEAETSSKASFPMGKVTAAIAVPIVLACALIWFVDRRRRKGPASVV